MTQASSNAMLIEGAPVDNIVMQDNVEEIQLADNDYNSQGTGSVLPQRSG